MPDEKKYPTQPDEKGYYFASKEEENEGIRSKKHENGNEIKEVRLSNGRVAIIRKLKGRDMVETKKRIQNDNSMDFETANMSAAVSFEGKTEPPEYYLDDLYQQDYLKLLVAYGGLNF